MPLVVLNQIEKTISHLSRKEQLWLIERIVYHLREDLMKSDTGEQLTLKDQPVESVETPMMKKNCFLRIARSLKLEGPSDWSSRVEEYLYGEKKYAE